MSADTLNELFRQRKLWKGSRSPAPGQGIGTGFPPLDEILPYRGWPRGAVMAAVVSDWGIGELSLFLPLMAYYNRDNRYVSWIAPPHTPYAPALTAAGLDLSLCRVLKKGDRAKKGDRPLFRGKRGLSPFFSPYFPSFSDQQILWCAEKLLQSSACGLVLAWPRTLSGRAVRRLQLAVEDSGASCVLFHRERPGGGDRSWDAGPATMHLRLSRIAAGLKLEILKARGTCRYSGVVLDL